jgi:hypothetical protein
MNFIETVSLAAGEAAIVETSGKVTLRLANGTAEIAGRSLAANEPCSFRSARRGIHFYSLEGGTVNVSSNAAFQIQRSPTPIASLVPMIRSFLSHQTHFQQQQSQAAPFSLQPGSKILVVGHKNSGKTLAARTLVNFLFRDSITQRRGASSIESATLICGDASTTSDMCLGPSCVSAVRVRNPGISINAPFLNDAHVTFFRAAGNLNNNATSEEETAGQNSSSFLREEVSQSLHWLSQAVESFRNVLQSSTGFTIVDAPISSSSTSNQQNNNNNAVIENFYANLLEIVEPSLILFIGGENDASATPYYTGGLGGQQKLSSEARIVKNLIDKMNAEAHQLVQGRMEFVAMESFVTLSSTSSDDNKNLTNLIADRIEDYFCGTPEFPMKCAKIVVPLNKIHFLTLSKSSAAGNQAAVFTGSRNSNNHLAPHRVDVAKFHRKLVGRLCAVSLAAVEAETAYANIAGMVLIESIDVNENELVLYAPAGGSGPEETCLVRPFLLVGDSRFSYLNHTSRGLGSVDANAV